MASAFSGHRARCIWLAVIIATLSPAAAQVLDEAGREFYSPTPALDPETLRVTVVAEMGGPVSMAKIEAWRLRRMLPGLWPKGIGFGKPATCHTDADGSCELTTLSGAYAVRVTAPGFAPSETRQFWLTGSQLDFILERGSEVSARVIDGRTGAFIPSATVEVRSELVATDALVERATDPCGEVALRLEPGRHELVARADGYEPTRRVVPVGSRPAKVEPIVLQRSRPIHARVTDVSGAAIRGAFVALDCGAPVVGPTALGETDSSGDAILESPHDCGSYWLSVHHPNFIDVDRAVVHPYPLEGDRLGLLIRLDHGDVASGLVRDDGGLPVEGARIWLAARGIWGEPVATGPDGSFRGSGLPSPVSAILVEAPGFQSLQTMPSYSLRRLRRHPELALSRGHLLEGRLLDEHNQPIAGATVSVHVGKPIREPCGTWSDWWGYSGPVSCSEGRSGRQVVQSDSRGKFRFSGLDEGIAEVLVHAQGFAPVSVEVPKGAQWTEISLRPGASIEGTVIDSESGRQVPAASVLIHPLAPGGGLAADGIAEEAPDHTFTGPDGAFLLRGLAAGSYALVVTAKAHTPSSRSIDIEAGEAREDVTIALRPGLSVTGLVVRAADSAPVNGAVVECESCSGFSGPLFDATDEAGRFQLTGLASDRVTLSVSHPAYAPQEVRMPHPPADGREVEITLRLTPGGAIQGVVTFNRSAVAGARITGPGIEVHTDESGRFEIESAPAGTENLLVESDRLAGTTYSEARRELDVSAKTSTSTQIEIKPRTRLTVVVRRDGKPVRKGTVRLDPGRLSWGFLVASVDSKGVFEVRDVYPGPVKIEFSGDDGYLAQDLLIPDVEHHHVVLDLPASGIVGTVIDAASGNPVRNAQVKAESEVMWARRPAASRRDGRFTLENIPPGRYDLTACSKERELLSVVVDVPEGQIVEGVLMPLRLRKGSRVLTVTGKVLRPDGEPAFPCAVVLDGPAIREGNSFYCFDARSASIAYTDPDGRYAIPDVPEGTYRGIALPADGLAPALQDSIDLDPGHATLDFSLVPEARLLVQVRREDMAMSGADVEIQPLGWPIGAELWRALREASGWSKLTDGQGIAEFDGLAAGEYAIRVISGIEMRRAAVRVSPGQTHEVETSFGPP